MTKQFSGRLLVCNYALATLVSALLLFEVQPIISKFILPWFGGSPAVWTTCMVFFQTVLFCGYAYAHVSQRYLSPRWQAIVHVALLAAAVWMLPIAPDARWKFDSGGSPTWRILLLLAVSVGLPYFVLSATGPLVQAWFCRSFPGRSPYRLYALSNFGSLVALLAYPFFVEPGFALARQTWLWAVGFVAFALLCGAGAVCAAQARRVGPGESTEPIDHGPQSPITWRRRLAWLALPALASMMLLATTNHVCQDVAVMPFLWIAPLSLYLVSFIVCFDHPRWYRRKEFALAALVSLGSVTAVDQLITGGAGIHFSFAQELTLHFLALFCLCMICHGELFRWRPDPRHLTSFYLMIAAGGAVGGMFVSLVAPRVFTTLAEWRLGLVAGCLLAAWVVFDGRQQSFFRRRFTVLASLLVLAFVGLNWLPQFQAAREHELFVTARNFYGVISVLECNADNPQRHTLNFYSGRIVHGIQFVAPEKRRQPTAYLGRSTGVGIALAELEHNPRARVGVVGLGMGTLAVYAQPGQTYRFYEINADVLRFADEYFSFLRDCLGTTEVVLGDGRLSLEQEEPQGFDLLVLDVFTGDAVPTHLLTKEAFDTYRRHLQPGARLAFHISNRYLDLTPVVAGLADHFGYSMQHVVSPANPALGQFAADWIVLSPPTAGNAQHLTGAQESRAAGQRTLLWTDDRSNLFEILK
jgi:hypothetical protein